MPDRDMLYEKYRVFHNPDPNDYASVIGSSGVKIRAEFFAGNDTEKMHGGEIWLPLEEVEGFAFVLKPETDHHARVALAAYMASCANEFPQLSDDLKDILNDDLV